MLEKLQLIEERYEAVSYTHLQECYTLTGSHDFLLKIVARDTQSYRDFIIDTLTANPIISSVETLVVLGVEKRTTSVPVELSGDGKREK